MKITTALSVLGLLAAADALPKIQKGIHPRKIVGGSNARQGEFPYQLSLRQREYHICGAPLVVINGQQVAITAAHCVESGSASSYTVIAGDRNKMDNSRFEQERQITEIIPHERYDSELMINDIAILKFHAPFVIDSNVAPIPLPRSRQQTRGDVVVTGWGTTSKNGESAIILQKVQIPVISDEICQKAYFSEIILSSQLCAGLIEEGGKDSCQGDEGGPVRAVDGGYLAGIVSWGYGCGNPGFPGVSTEVSYFIDWLNAKV